MSYRRTGGMGSRAVRTAHASTSRVRRPARRRRARALLPHRKAGFGRVAEDLGLVELCGVRGQDVIEARRGQVQRIAVDVAAGWDRAGEESCAVVAQLDVVDVGTEVLRLARPGRRVTGKPWLAGR